MNKHLVSIIIPVYNRAHLIGETLDSIMLQTYVNWECIVVDDGSTDATVEVVQNYKEKDTRIKLFHRPKDRLMGGNAARNFGLKMSSGVYVNWFDSDDLMTTDFIKSKLEILFKHPTIDFVVSKSVNYFPKKGIYKEIGYYDENHIHQLNVDNFIMEKVHWITDDFFLKKEKIGRVNFDEKLISGQEYNFCINIMAKNDLNGFYLDRKLSKRRIHKDSIQELQNIDEFLAYKNKYVVIFKTFRDVYAEISGDSKVFFVNRILNLSFSLLKNKRIPSRYMLFLYFYYKQYGFLKSLKLFSYSVLLFAGKNSYSLKQELINK